MQPSGRRKSGFLEILNALHDRHVEFVIVGGVATALHGGSRATFDLDLVTSLTPASWPATVDLLWSLGARPRSPEPVERIRDGKGARHWRRENGVLALNFQAADDSMEVELLVGESDAFFGLRQRAVEVTVDQRTFFVASINDLICMKRRAGKPQDLLDIAELRNIQKRLH